MLTHAFDLVYVIAEWSDVAVDYLRHNLGLELSLYTHKIFIVPKGYTCNWGGMGYVGCGDDCRAWISGDIWDVSHRSMQRIGNH